MSTLTLDIGYKLTPKPESEWLAPLTKAQRRTYMLIRSLGASCGEISEVKMASLLGVADVRPFRSRVKHLIEKGAITSTKVD